MECLEKQQGDLVSGWAVGFALLTGLVAVILSVVVFDYLQTEIKNMMEN